MREALILSFFIFLSLSVNADKNSRGLFIPRGDSTELPQSFFINLSTDKQLKSTNDTKVWMTYFTKGLKFIFECNEQKMNNNFNVKANSCVKKMEVLQMTLSGSGIAAENFEIKLNPKNEISVYRKNRINSYKTINAKKEGIRYGVTRENSKSWKGWVFLPFKLIGRFKKYKLSFVRIVKFG